jgi:TRAP-type C4-dicarboxylate transport system permease small subunit
MGVARPTSIILDDVTDETPQTTSRAQRVLAFTAAGLVILSIACFFALMIGTWAGAGPDQSSGRGIWPTVELLPLAALPLAFVLIIVLLVVSLVSRSKQNRRAER